MKQKVFYFNQEKVVGLNRVLDSLGIESEFISLEEGQFFDMYDISLSSGVKFNKIQRSLSDIGLAIKSHSTPKGYPILSEGIYRIEVQTKEIEPLLFSEYTELISNTSLLAPVPLGLDFFGNKKIIDISALPNLLIAGTPGSGKSVFLHSMILSLIKNNAELYLVDPKMVEFHIYDGYDSVKSIDNTVEQAMALVEHLKQIMDYRFKKLSSAGCRDILEYNSTNSKKLKPIVLIVDEWADLVLQDKNIQKPLCVIAQKGRAAGISIVLATQRPAREVISGLIKANFSGRIAFKVNSSLDSRIILDRSGAEKIIDVGTGFYQDQKMPDPIMFRSPLVHNPLEILLSLRALKKPQTFWGKIREMF